MGIKTYPGYTLHGNDCFLHFWPDPTPKKLYASFQGITKGTSIPPSVHPVPNGIYVMEQMSGKPCEWEYTDPNVAGSYVITALGSSISLQTIAAEGTFLSNDPAKGAFWFSNLFPPAAKFTGGYCQISTRIPTNPIPCMQTILEFLDENEDSDQLAEFFPVSDGNAVFKYCRKQDKTNIKILIDQS